MRMLIAAAMLAGCLGSSTAVMAQDGQHCGPDPACAGEYPLRLAPAAVPGPPLIWSPTRGRLIPPPVAREPVLLGRTIPLGEIVGRKVRPIGPLPAPVIYNKPLAELDPRDPSVVLMSLGPRRAWPILRRAD